MLALLANYFLVARAAEHTNLTTLVTTWNEALTGAFPTPSLSSFPSQLKCLLSQGFNAKALCPLGPLHLFARNRNILGFSILADTLTPDDALRCLATRDPSNATLFHYLAESPAPGLSRVLTLMRHESSDARASLAAALGFTQGFPQWSGDTLSKAALEESAGAPELLILQKHLDSLPAAAKEVALNSKRAPYGLTPLDTACSHGREAVAVWLAANGGRGKKAGCHLWQPTLGKEEEELSLVSPLGMQGSHALPLHTLPPSFSLDAHTKVGWRALPPHALKKLGYNSDVLRPSVELPSSPAVTFALPMDELSLGALTPENRRQLEEAYLIEGAKPFIIRGGTNSSQVFDTKTLLRIVGGKDTMLTFGGIPYSSEYNRGGGTITAGDFISSYMGQRNGGDPNNSEAPPPLVFDNSVLKGSASGLSALHQRRRNALFNGAPVGLSQLILGPAGSGSALHYHPAAVNFLVLGLKAWVLVPPSSAGFFDGTAQDWWTRILPNMTEPRVEVLQGPADMIYIPKNWGHAVINLVDSLATAYEALY